MFCTKCGSPNEDSSKFCSACGEPLITNIETPKEEPVNSSFQTPPVPEANQSYTYSQSFNAPYKAPITGKNIAKCLILTIITCGIYGIFWFIRLVDDLNTASQTSEDSSGITVLLLGLVTCGIYIFYWYYKAGDKVNKIKTLSGQLPGDNSILYLLLGIFGLGLVNYILIQSELNKVAVSQE